MGMIHGGNILATARELGCNITELIDMSSNLTPMTVAPGLMEVLRQRLHEISVLPETGSETLCGHFARTYNLTAAQVLTGNGTTEFIHNIPNALSTSRAIVVTPTYSDYYTACQRIGLLVTEFQLLPENNFHLDLAALAAMLQGNELVFLCNPNNPTSTLLLSTDLLACIQAAPQSIFVVDESYLPFVREPSLLDFPLPANLLVLRSFSKMYGIPGLRLGFLAGAEGLMRAITEQRRPWEVNRLAQIAGEYCLTEADGYVDMVARFIAKHRPTLAAGLAALPGVRVFPGSANFILCRLESGINVETLRQELLRHRIMIRNCANITGLDARYFRVCLKQPADNDFFLTTIGRILS